MHDQTQYDQIQDNLRRTVSSGTIALTPLPHAPEISLLLISEDYPRGRLDHDEMLRILEQPAYWAFCWASGQVLARYLLDRPALVAGNRVLDFGAGSGVVAIAAAMAGAAEVIACDIDPDALAATAANAEIAGVEVTLLDDIEKLDHPVDIAIAADVLYDRDNLPWLERLPTFGREVIIADSRMKRDVLAGYEVIDRQTATTVPDLDELKEFTDVRVYRCMPARPGMPG